MNLFSDNIIAIARSGRPLIVNSSETALQIKAELPNPENDNCWVSTLDSWVTYLLKQSGSECTLLSKLQDEDLLETHIKSLCIPEFHNTKNIKPLFFKAKSDLSGAGVPFDKLTPETNDQRLFSSTIKTYHDAKIKEGWISIEDTYSIVTKKILTESIQAPMEVTHLPFQGLTIAQNSLIDACKSKGTTFVEIKPDNRTITKPLKKEYKNLEEEVYECIKFIKRNINENNESVICITSPIIDSISECLHKAILESFANLLTPIEAICHPCRTAKIDTTLEFQQVSNLLKYLFDSNEIELTDEKEIELLELVAPNFIPPNQNATLDDIIAAISSVINPLAEITPKRIAIQSICDATESTIERIQDIKLTRKSIQQTEIIETFLTLVGQSLLSKKTKPKYNIHLLHPEQLGGKNFDIVWMLNTNADHLPINPKPSPLISSTDIAKNKLYEANKDFITQQSENIRRIVQSSYEFIYSYSELDEDKELLGPTILPDADELFIHQAEQNQELDNENLTEYIDDTYTTKLPNKGRCPGGTRYIELHNQCPFMSNYIARYPTTLKKADDNFKENNARGNIIHEFLEGFWKAVKSSKELRDLSKNNLNKLIDKHLQLAIETIKAEAGLDDWFFDNEYKIVRKLISKFLELEKKRNFEIVSLEQKHYLKFENLTFTVFADRIEREIIEENNCAEELIFVSDHKSGEVTTSDWLKDPVQKPQVPIYTQIPNIDGAVFNVISAKEITYKGVVDYDKPKEIHITPPRGLKNSWETQKDIWAKNINESVKSMKSGFGAPQPFKKLVCQRCELSNICRSKLK